MTVKVEYFVYAGIAITVALGMVGEFQIRKARRQDEEKHPGDSE